MSLLARNGKGFCITAPHAKYKICISNSLNQLFFDGIAHLIVPLLIVPVVPDEHSAASGAPQNLTDSTPATRSPRTTFSTLPFEVYSLIFNNLDPVDITCVGIAMPCLWDVTQDAVLQRYRTMLGLWAGEQIICVDTDVAVDDYPAGLLSASEVAAILSGEKPEVWDDDPAWSKWDDWGGGTQPCHTLYALEGDGVWAMTEAQAVYNQCAMRCRASGHLGSKKQVDAKLLEICMNGSGLVPRGQSWILRNLTTKEFVTSAGIALDAEFIKGPVITGIGFGHAILCRTCWSLNSSDDSLYGGQIHSGVWAGHRLDITTRERHDRRSKDEEWKDVSDEVAAEIAAICENEYGAGWRERYV